MSEDSFLIRKSKADLYIHIYKLKDMVGRYRGERTTVKGTGRQKEDTRRGFVCY